MAEADDRLLRDTCRRVRTRLLEERTGRECWEGRLSSSALSTAVAVGALHLADAADADAAGAGAHAGSVAAGLDWLERHRNADGGWGDTPESPSNLSTTTLVLATQRLAGRPADARAAAYVDAACAELLGGPPGATGGRLRDAILAAYGEDRTFSVPILTYACLAGLVDWADVPALPFELAALPQGLFRFLRLPVVSYALPALIAMGVARHASGPVGRHAVWTMRRWATPAALRRLERIQPDSGGYLEAIPLTAFVAASLLAAGRLEPDVARRARTVVQRGVAFLRAMQRPSGAWAIDADLSVWNTTMAVHALGGWPDAGKTATAPGLRDPDATGSTLRAAVSAIGDPADEWSLATAQAVRDWLLERQFTSRHPYTGSPPGGWAWTHRPGGVPDADDTAGALLALRVLPPSPASAHAAAGGAKWLLGLQNRDGGWPTFCRGWGRLEFDRSGADLTAHVLRALHAWRAEVPPALAGRIERATRRGLAYLAKAQRPDGSLLPLWFGNPWAADHANPVLGTARVLLAYADLGIADDPAARRARAYLLGAAGPEGAWGGAAGLPPTIEETSVTIEALAAAGPGDAKAGSTLARAATWLAEALRGGRWRQPSPIGLYFARLWYHEKLYPISLSAGALRKMTQSAGRVESDPERRR